MVTSAEVDGLSRSRVEHPVSGRTAAWVEFTDCHLYRNQPPGGL